MSTGVKKMPNARVQHQALLRKRLRDPEARREVVRVGILQPLGNPFCPPMNAEGTPFSKVRFELV